MLFLKYLARAYPDRELHLVMDKHATHYRAEVRAWLAANSRIHSAGGLLRISASWRWC
jgi:hypothetical protein